MSSTVASFVEIGERRSVNLNDCAFIGLPLFCSILSLLTNFSIFLLFLLFFSCARFAGHWSLSRSSNAAPLHLSRQLRAFVQNGSIIEQFLAFLKMFCPRGTFLTASNQDSLIELASIRQCAHQISETRRSLQSINHLRLQHHKNYTTLRAIYSTAPTTIVQ